MRRVPGQLRQWHSFSFPNGQSRHPTDVKFLRRFPAAGSAFYVAGSRAPPRAGRRQYDLCWRAVHRTRWHVMKVRKRQHAFIWIGVMLASMVGVSWSCSPSQPVRVVLVTIDTLRADHLGYHGYPRDTAPFLDGLAERSAVFTRAITSSSHTGPSHASLLTSLHPAQHGILFNGMSLKAGVPTLAEAFASSDLRTAGHVSVGFLRELRMGFETFTAEERDAHEIVNAAIAWTDSLSAAEPFFLWLHFYDVHESARNELAAEVLPYQRRVLASADLSGAEWTRFLRTRHGLTSEGAVLDELLQYIDRYDAQIAYVDAELERFHGALAERGLLRDSLWVVTADHGEGLGSHGARGHGEWLWNEQVHAPLILHFADGAHAGKQLEGVVRHVDLLPTLGEFAGLRLPSNGHSLEGRSLMPLLRGEPDEERLAVSQRRPPRSVRDNPELNGDEMISIQTTTHKYIRHSHGADHFFDLRVDPLEQRDLIEQDAPEKDFLLQELSRVYGRLDPQLIQRGDLEINPEHLLELKALGYIE